ncbi:hypothetical protein ACWDSJ_20840 [Nocardia sp. NPDC003482]
MDGSRESAGDRADDTSRRLTAKVTGPAIAAGAVSLGLVLIGSCGLGHQDIYVAPPPLNSDLQSAQPGTRSTSTTPGVLIPPSPTWRIAINTPPRRTPTSATTSTTTSNPPVEPADGQPRPAEPARNESPAPAPEPPRNESPAAAPEPQRNESPAAAPDLPRNESPAAAPEPPRPVEAPEEPETTKNLPITPSATPTENSLPPATSEQPTPARTPAPTSQPTTPAAAPHETPTLRVEPATHTD